MDFFDKFDHIHSFLEIWSHLIKKSAMENGLGETIPPPTTIHHHPPSAEIFAPPPSTTTHHHPPPFTTTHQQPRYIHHLQPQSKIYPSKKVFYKKNNKIFIQK